MLDICLPLSFVSQMIQRESAKAALKPRQRMECELIGKLLSCWFLGFLSSPCWLNNSFLSHTNIKVNGVAFFFKLLDPRCLIASRPL